MTSNKEKGIQQNVVKSLVYQLVRGVNICHKKQVLHRDLKPQNILINNQGLLKLADFGLARTSGIPVKGYTHQVVTLWYRPPDVLLGSQKYTSSIDIWSLGCIFAQISNLKPLFPGSKQQDQLQRIFKALGSPDPTKWLGLQQLPQYSLNAGKFIGYQGQQIKNLVPKLCQKGVDLLSKMLRYNPSQRITAAQALKHPYFNDLPKQLLKFYQKK